MSLMKKVFNGVIKSIDEQEMTLTAAISTNGIDRMREVLDPKGVDLSNYKKNPVVLWAHDYSLPPIGKALWVKKDGNGIVSKVKFANTPFAKEIFDLYKEGFMSAFSVGFIPKSTDECRDEDRNDPKKPRRTFTKWELLEYSAVPVPANPEALALALQKGVLTSTSLKEMLEKSIEEEGWSEDETEEKDTKENETKEEVLQDKTEGQVKDEPTDKGLSEVLAELELVNNKVKELETENLELRIKLFELLNKPKDAISEITVDSVAEKITSTINGVIRKAQGKIN